MLTLVFSLTGSSVVLQVVTAVLALRLVRITGKRSAWFCMAVAMTAMAVLRAVVMPRLNEDGTVTGLDLFEGGLTFLISALLFAGITRIRPAFVSVQTAEARTRSMLDAVQAEKDRLAALVNSIRDEVWFADPQKRFTLANPSALREFAFQRAEGIDIHQLIQCLTILRPDGSPRPKEEAPALRALAGETVEDQEEIVRTPASGELRYRQVNAAPVRDATGGIIGAVCVVRDITERKRAQQALREAHDELERRVEARTAQLRQLTLELARVEQRERRRIAHVLHEDLLQMLAALKIRLESLQNLAGSTQRDAAGEAVRILEASIRVGRSLTQEIAVPVLHEMGMGEALKWLAEDMRAKFNLAVELNIGDYAKLGSEDLRSVLFHATRELLFNVHKHAGVRQAAVRIRRAMPGGVTIEVEDAGVGFDPVVAERGGLGLFGIRERLIAMGGRMTIISAPGQGTRVSLTLPA